MVENTVKKPQKKYSLYPGNSIFLIAGGVFAALVFSVYWQFNKAQNFFSMTAPAPEFNIKDENWWSMLPGQAETTADPYKYFSTPDGYFSIKYPSSFTDGQKVIEQTAGTKIDPNNSLLFAYKIDLSISNITPSSLAIARYDATSTQEVIDTIKQSLDKQQCPSEIKKNEDSAKSQYEIFDSTYKCGDQGDLSFWQARIAVIPKNDREFYAVTIATVSKNWETFKLEANSIIDSISINQPAEIRPEENPSGEGGNNL